MKVAWLVLAVLPVASACQNSPQNENSQGGEPPATAPIESTRAPVSETGRSHHTDTVPGVAEAPSLTAPIPTKPAAIIAPPPGVPTLASPTPAGEGMALPTARSVAEGGNSISDNVAHGNDASRAPPAGEAAPPVPAPSFPDQGTATALSRRAAAIAMGDSRERVIKMLGAPTWAILPADRGDFTVELPATLSLSWDNGECVPVEISFDRRMQVNGTNEGRVCGLGDLARPRAQYSCKRKDRQRFCR